MSMLPARPFVAAACVALSYVLWSSQAVACELPSGNSPEKIAEDFAIDLGCYGGTRDESELTRWFSQSVEPVAAARGAIGDVELDAIENIVSRLQAELRQRAKRMRDSGLQGVEPLNRTVERMKGLVPSEVERPQVATDWSYDPDNDMVGHGDDGVSPRKQLLEPNCHPNAGPDHCAEAIRAMADLIRISTLAGELAQKMDDTLFVHARTYTVRLEQWRLYTLETRPQYFWEMLINGALYRRSRGLGDWEGALTDRRPPESQVIFLHPSLALEYVSGAEPGSRFEPAVLMEWVGYNRWSYSEAKGDGLPNMKGGLGASLVTTVSDRTGTRTLGHGVAVHWRHVYTLGVTWRSNDDIGLFFSMAFGERASRAEARVAEVRDRFGFTRTD